MGEHFIPMKDGDSNNVILGWKILVESITSQYCKISTKSIIDSKYKKTVRSIKKIRGLTIFFCKRMRRCYVHF